MIIAFSWGIYRLMASIDVARGRSLPTGFDNDRNNWTFGQVVSIALLLAPLVTIVGHVRHGRA